MSHAATSRPGRPLRPRRPTLRPMTEADLPAVLEIERRSYDFPWSPGIFRDCLRAGHCCRVLEEAEGRLLGYAILAVGAGEGHVLNLCIDPEHRRQGHGSYLLRRIIQSARRLGAGTLYLEVRPSNKAALRLYERLGFREVGRRKGYYPALEGREDALVLALAL